MFKRISYLLIGLLALIFSSEGFSLIPKFSDYSMQDRSCVRQPYNPYSFVVASTESLNKVLDKFVSRETLVRAKITHGRLKFKVGTAHVYLNTVDGKIVDLNIDASVGIFGINERIRTKITLDQILRGEPLRFTMNGSNRAVLKVVPLNDMTEHGGTAQLQIWDGKKYKIETISLKKINGKFVAQKGPYNSGKKIKSLNINMGGLSIPHMYVRKYKIKT